jgi:serine/threonine protein kinase
MYAVKEVPIANVQIR